MPTSPASSVTRLQVPSGIRASRAMTLTLPFGGVLVEYIRKGPKGNASSSPNAVPADSSARHAAVTSIRIARALGRSRSVRLFISQGKEQERDVGVSDPTRAESTREQPNTPSG